MTQSRQERLAQKLAVLKKRLDDERDLAENNRLLTSLFNVEAEVLDWQGDSAIGKIAGSVNYHRDVILLVPFFTDSCRKLALRQFIELVALPGDELVAISIRLRRQPYWTNWFNFKGVMLLRLLQRIFDDGVDFVINVGGSLFLVDSNEDELRVCVLGKLSTHTG